MEVLQNVNDNVDFDGDVLVVVGEISTIS